MTVGNFPVQTQIAWHPGRHATRSPRAPARGFLWVYRASPKKPRVETRGLRA